MKSAFTLWLVLLGQAALAQTLEDFPQLPRSRYHSGQDVLNAFKPVSARLRDSVVELNVGEDPVALGAVVDASGLVLTKASELKSGKLTCWLASGKEVDAKLLAADEDNDVALVRVQAAGLKPIEWAAKQLVEGQWAVTPGLSDTPQAVGIISALTHTIRAQRAFIGIRWDTFSARPVVSQVEPGFGAEKAGVKPGDLIVAVDHTNVTNASEVADILGEFHDGQTVQIRFKRKEEVFDARIELMLAKPGTLFASDGPEDSLRGDVSARNGQFEEAIEHDTVIEPWQCGGPLVNLDGQVIGLNIARASRFATYALPAPLARKILAKLKSQTQQPSPPTDAR
ncbi:MAG TPA: trypsin-like peptidase domain-containing protein [Verrucomicrobiae bacterium]|jgi:serine protease Do